MSQRKLAADKLYSESIKSYDGNAKGNNFMVWIFGLAVCSFTRHQPELPYKTWIYSFGLLVLIAFSVLSVVQRKQVGRYQENTTLNAGLTGLLLSLEFFAAYCYDIYKTDSNALLSGLVTGALWYFGVVGFFLGMRYYVRHSNIKDGGQAPNKGLMVSIMLIVGIIIKVLLSKYQWTPPSNTFMYSVLFLSCVTGIGISYLPEYWIMRKERLQNEQKARG